MSAAHRLTIDEVLERVEILIDSDDGALRANAAALADEYLVLGEAVLETWLEAKGSEPTQNLSEGFRLLALHRQAARGNPSFNACRETCREVVYHRNLILDDLADARLPQKVRLGAMVVRHLGLFVGGKLQADGLGDFCCSSRPVRQADAVDPKTEPARIDPVRNETV